MFTSPVLRLRLKMAVGFWVFLALLLVAVAAVVVVEAAAISVKNASPSPLGWEEDVVVGAGHVLEHYLAGCHVVIAAPRLSPALASLLREVSAVSVSVALVDITLCMDLTPRNVWNEGSLDYWQRLWDSGVEATCRVLVMDHTAADIASAASLLTCSDLWQQADTRVLIMGRREDVEVLLRNEGLRNTRHAMYLTPHAPTQQQQSGAAKRGVIDLYTRCLYCDAGGSKLQLTQRWNLSDLPQELTIFPEQHKAFTGSMLRVVAKTYFPLFDYEPLSDKPGTLVTPKDSLCARMIATLAAAYNFTCVVREPEDGQWGLLTSNGNWTGLVGKLQYENADFSLDITVTLERSKVVDFTVPYVEEPVVILSPKPRPLPEYLSLVRPLEATVWIAVVLSVFAWGTTLWLMQMGWHWISGGRRLSFSTSIFYGWAVLLEDHPYQSLVNASSQVLVGAWLIVGLIVTTGYRSSLISHLVVQGKSAVINSMEELVDRRETDGWRWGTRRMTGVLKNFLSSSSDPAIVQVYKHMETADIDEGMKRVVDGGFSYIYNYYYSKSMVATTYTDDTGYTPVHLSRSKYPLFSGNAWAFRRGAPFRSHFNKAILKLLDAGLVTFWMDDVINNYVRRERRRRAQETGGQVTIIALDDEEVVLGLRHMQGTFYTLMLGHSLAFIAFVTEYLYQIH
ncbi:glutamate receptor-like [Scylla paramamosain]|uniref:glutamate receptor-like n=1 Tax=Scylla paramamosain TaxID=85552 RepID=UPI003082D6A0